MTKPLVSRINLTLSRYWFRTEMGEQYAVSAWLFLPLLAIIYFLCFWSLSPQIPGVGGSHGILPVRETMNAAIQDYSWLALLRYPTLFWYGSRDLFLIAVVWIGLVSSVSLFFGLFAS